MTAGNNGAGTPPEDDDPFAHLYRPEGGSPQAGAGRAGDSTAHIPGVPRTSYTQVRAVGERTYGGQQQVPPQQGYAAYGQASPSPHYAAPETYGGAPPPPPPFQEGYDEGHGRRGGGRGGAGRRGLMLGAVAVVATVVIAIVAAVLFSGDGESGDDVSGSDQTPAAGADDGKNGDDKPKKDPGALPSAHAAELTPGGNAAIADDVAGAESPDGEYIAGISNPGDSVTWEAEVPESGKYSLYARYGVVADSKLTLTVNGGKPQELNMENYTGAQSGEWEKGWTTTFGYVTLDEGSNRLKISCETGDTCGVNLDKVWLVKGWVQ